MTAPQKEPAGSEREAFEAFASDNGKFPKAIERRGEGYLLAITQSYWTAWKACEESFGAAEAAEILASLISNIERDGMYSKESTLGFLSQAYYCLRPANGPDTRASQPSGAAGDLVERLKQEAQIRAQEARTANSTIAEIYRIVSNGTGEPGNWNGAEPVRKCIEDLRASLASPSSGGWQSAPMEPTPEMIEAGMKRMFDEKRYSAPWDDVINLMYRAMLAAAPKSGDKSHE